MPCWNYEKPLLQQGLFALARGLDSGKKEQAFGLIPYLLPAMKAFLTLLVTGLLAAAATLPSRAQNGPVVVDFAAERGAVFQISLDNRPLTVRPTGQLHLENLAPGQHWAEFTVLGQPGAPLRVRAALWLEPGLATSFVLTQRPGYGLQLRQVGTAALAGYGYEGQGRTYGQPEATGPGQAGYPPYPPLAGQPPYPPAPGYPAPEAGYLVPMRSADVANLAQALRRCNFDDKRLPLLYQALAQSSLRAGDLALLVRTMTFSDSQKETAKFGYAHLVDPQNFYRVLEALTFSTSANEILADLGLARR